MERRIILAVLATFPVALQSELLPIRTYNTADGLAADHVDCVVSDSRGFLWFCTPEGLSRFDGVHFISYGQREGLPHRFVTSFLETRSGDHWVGTLRGLVRINERNRGAAFATYRMQEQRGNNGIGALLERRTGEIVATTSAGLFGWRTPAHFLHIGSPLTDSMNIAAIAEGADGTLWLGTTGGIVIVRGNEVVQQLGQKDGLPGQWVEDLLRDSRGRMWAAVRGGLAMMTHGDAGWRVNKIFREESGLVYGDVKALFEASDGVLWVGTAAGINCLRVNTDDPTIVQTLTRAQGLSDRQIIALGEDQAGNIWAGTEGAGVMRIARVGFATYRESFGLDADRAMAVLEDRAGEILAVTVTGPHGKRAVNIFDGSRFRSIVPKAFGEHGSWGWNRVLLQSRTGEWWAATDQGLCRFDRMKAADLDGRSPRACYAKDSTVFRIFEDSTGGVWASAQSSAGDLLMRWDSTTDTVYQFPAPRVSGVPANDLVSAFAEDRQGDIWLGLYRGGMYRCRGRQFQYFSREDGLPGGPVLALLTSRDGSLWIGSGAGGLARITNPSEERPRFQVYDTERGMASNRIDCLVEDLPGRIYAGTGKGLDRLDPKTGYIRHFSGAEGLAHGEFKSAARDRSGALWFATTQGLSRLTNIEDRPPAVSRVLITDLQVAGAPYPVSQLGETRISELELKPSQNQLRVDFVGIDYEPGDTLRYSYKLEGADANFSAPRNQQTVNYAALSAGTYRFLVKAVDSEGVESATPAEIDFLVLPPLWRRWWFEGLVFALMIGLVFAAHRYRVTQVVNLERMRTAIATDLHDDIGASLSQIAILSEVARVEANGSDRAREPLEKIATLARELVDSMGDIVWSIRSEPHSMDSLIRRMREFALDLLSSQGVAFELRAPSGGAGIQLGLQGRRQLFLIFKECIHNAARHSHATKVTAELRILGRELVMTVQDDGRGLENGERHGANGGTGIPSMRRRAESLGGRVEIVFTPGEGCRVSAYLPARHGSLA